MSTSSRIEHCMRTLALSRDCAALGARVRTIHHITGMRSRELLRLLFSDRALPPRGRIPDTREWYHNANLLCRAQASMVIANFQRLGAMGFAPGDALVCAYRYYQSLFQPPYRISFDRAFDLAAHTQGIWIAKSCSFTLAECPDCASVFMDAPGAAGRPVQRCPFCRLVQRHTHWRTFWHIGGTATSRPDHPSRYHTRATGCPCRQRTGSTPADRGQPAPSSVPDHQRGRTARCANTNRSGCAKAGF